MSSAGSEIPPELPRKAVRSLPIISWEIDADGVFTRSEGAALERLGLRDGQAVGQNVLLAFPRTAPYIRRALAGETVEWEAQGWATDGPWTFQVVAMPTANGGALGVSVDVTERVRAERRHQELVEALPDILVTTDLSGVLTSLNAAFEAVTGLAREDWIGERLLPLVHPDDVITLQRVLIRVGRGEEPPLFDVRVRRTDDSFAQLECRMRPQLHGSGVVGAQGIARDVTERRLLEADVRHSQRLDSIGKLAGGIAHDFNNLLLVISGHAALIQEELPEGSVTREHAEHIARSAERAAELTRRLLAFGRKQALAPVRLRVDDAVRQTAEMLSRLIGEDIDVDIISEAGSAEIEADPAQLEQVLVNLGVNARDALESGGTLRFRTSRTTLSRRRAQALDIPEGRYVRIVVEDDGCGMDAETVERIFDPFFTTKASGHGTGLGLATVYGIVRQSGGGVSVTSAPGEGTRFELYLPRVRRRARDRRNGRAGSARDAGGGSGHILLVEDDADVREFVSIILSSNGYRVTQAQDGAAAVEALSDDAAIDLVVSDVVMPRMGGFELLDHLRRELPGVPVLLVSGYAENVNSDERLRRADDFLPKPFLPDELLARVHRLARARPAD